MKSLIIVFTVLFLALPAQADQWEGWEPKRTLPAQAVETLEAQAIPQHEPELQPSYEPPWSAEMWRPLVAEYDGWNVDRMIRIMACESEGVPHAQNPRSTATGLFQIMASIWYPNGPRSDLHDPYFNTATAHYVWQMQGYGAWVCVG